MLPKHWQKVDLKQFLDHKESLDSRFKGLTIYEDSFLADFFLVNDSTQEVVCDSELLSDVKLTFVKPHRLPELRVRSTFCRETTLELSENLYCCLKNLGNNAYISSSTSEEKKDAGTEVQEFRDQGKVAVANTNLQRSIIEFRDDDHSISVEEVNHECIVFGDANLLSLISLIKFPNYFEDHLAMFLYEGSGIANAVEALALRSYPKVRFAAFNFGHHELSNCDDPRTLVQGIQFLATNLQRHRQFGKAQEIALFEFIPSPSYKMTDEQIAYVNTELRKICYRENFSIIEIKRPAADSVGQWKSLAESMIKSLEFWIHDPRSECASTKPNDDH